MPAIASVSPETKPAERRFTPAVHRARVEQRADGQAVLAGYAAVFYDPADPGTQYELWTGFVERIAPGAFDRAIRERQDVRGLFNHDSDGLLGRLPAGTLRLAVNAVGLLYEIDLPDTQTGRDVATLVARGDVTGASFSFMPVVSQYLEEPDLTIRTLLDVDLYDVGPVTYPAYEATTAGLRSADGLAGARADYDAWRRRRDAQAVLVRLRCLEIEN